MVGLKSKPQLFSKMIIGTINLAVTVIFFLLLQKVNKTHHHVVVIIKFAKIYHKKYLKNDRAAKMAIWCEIIFDFLPTYSMFIAQNIMNMIFTTYIGETLILSASLEAATCGIFYWRIFRRTSNGDPRSCLKNFMYILYCIPISVNGNYI